jgi:hypothetical protein
MKEKRKGASLDFEEEPIKSKCSLGSGESRERGEEGNKRRMIDIDSI